MKKITKKLRASKKLIASATKNIYKQFKTFNEKMKKIWFTLALIMCLMATTSCNVTRTITNQSEYYQRGDTSVLIQTKTVETYDATKKGM